MDIALPTATTRPRLRFLLAMAAVLALGVGFSSLSHAGIGEARDVLIGEGGPYGNPSGETTATLKGSREKVDVFKRGPVTISAEYDADGKVWKISFFRKNFTEKHMADLLEKIGGADRKWSKPVSYRGNKHWKSTGKPLHAVYYSTPLYKMVIMSDEAVRAERLLQSLEGRETKRVAEDDPDTGSDDGDEKPEKQGDPLKDFWSE